jgi:NAD+ synthase (glutamine-hydrolysing)
MNATAAALAKQPIINDQPTRTHYSQIDVADFREEELSMTACAAAAKDSVVVAIAQIGTEPGQIPDNVNKIISYIEEAKAKGADIVVFPELSIPAYGSMDLFWNKFYLAQNLNAIEQIKEYAKGITVVVGFVDVDLDSIGPNKKPVLYNSLAILQDGQLTTVQDKTLLPEYDIFYEQRYFTSSRGAHPFTVKGMKIGAEVCEDMWTEGYETNPSDALANAGVQAVINASASPFHYGKFEKRSQLISDIVSKHNVPFIYANVIGAYDALYGQAVFDGRSVVVNEDGSLAAIGAGFKEQLILVDLKRPRKIPLPRIVPIEEVKDALIQGMRDYAARSEREAGAKFNKFIIGVSGGIDSALVLALAVEAFGKERVLAVTMPSKFSSGDTISDAYQTANNFGVEIDTMPLEHPFKALLETLPAHPRFQNLPENVAEENLQARLRMIYLMWYSNKLNGLVLGTGNKTELALNNCTVYGDMVGSLTVLGDVDKDRVYELSRLINQQHGSAVIPETTIERPPSAELKAEQIDADVMGDDPAHIAPLVREIIEKQLTLEEAVAMFAGTFSEELIIKTFSNIDGGEWKRRLGAQAIRVTPHAFGDGRRMPIGNGLYRHEAAELKRARS